MKIRVCRKLCLVIFEWCQTKFGESNYQKDFPKIHYRANPRKKQLMGEFFYKKNEIFIYGEEHIKTDNPVLAVVNTMIHEYKHYLQNMGHYETYFTKYTYSVDNHPYEKTCNDFAEREQQECYSFVLKNYKKHL